MMALVALTLRTRTCAICQAIVENRYRSLQSKTSQNNVYIRYLKELGIKPEGFLCYPCVNKLNKLAGIDHKISTGLNLEKLKSDRAVLITTLTSLGVQFATHAIPKKCCLSKDLLAFQRRFKIVLPFSNGTDTVGLVKTLDHGDNALQTPTIKDEFTVKHFIDGGSTQDYLNTKPADPYTPVICRRKSSKILRDLVERLDNPSIPESKAESPLHLGCEGDRWKKMKETLRMDTDALLAKHLLDIHKLYCSCDVDVKNTFQDDLLMNEKRKDIMDGGRRKRNLQMEPTTPSKVMRICPSSGECSVRASSSGSRDQELKSNGNWFGDGVGVETANPHVHDSLNSTDITSKEDEKLIEGEDFVVYKAEEDDVESSNEETDSDSTMEAPRVTMETHTKTMVTDRPVKQETPDSDDKAVSKSSSRTLCADPRPACRVPQNETDHGSFLIKEEPLCSDSVQNLRDIVSTQPSDLVYLDRDEAAEHSPSVEAGVLIPSPPRSSRGLLMKLASFIKQRSQTEHRPEILESLAKQEPQIEPACRVSHDGTDHASFPIKEEPLCSDSEQNLRDIVSTQPSDSVYIIQEIVTAD